MAGGDYLSNGVARARDAHSLRIGHSCDCKASFHGSRRKHLAPRMADDIKHADMLSDRHNFVLDRDYPQKQIRRDQEAAS